MRQAIGYIRVSTLEQANEGISLEAQQARIERLCEANDYQLAALYVDRGFSGKRQVVCINGALPSLPAGGCGGLKKIDVELAVMFGRETITQAASMDLARVSAMDCKAVAATAKEIRRARGYPKKQVRLARASLKEFVFLRPLLCRPVVIGAM